MQTVGETRILIAPLDWGLGHATRCIPLINALLRRRYAVFIAAEGKTEALLRQEFPHLTYIPLQGYRIRYAKTSWTVIGSLLLQVPKILAAIRRENQWLRKVVETLWIDVVISDNRYGLYCPGIYSIFITHQLRIKTPFSFIDGWLQKINYRLIGRFQECWVPDVAEPPGLAGHLSHPAQPPPVPLFYAGLLSRFCPLPLPPPPPKHLLIVLSGPEPQRGLLEEKLLTQLEGYDQPVIFIRGLPGEKELPPVPPHIFIKNHLPAAALQEAIAGASLVVGRCGYSTVMDLVCLQKKSILIPTPGQSEQEYLALHLTEGCLALCLPQHRFHLAKALELAQRFPYRFFPDTVFEDLQQLLDGLPERIKKKKG